MNRYSILCTESQTKKALELGAPINIEPYDNPRCVPQKCPKIIVKYPTAEQMIGWLEEQGLIISIYESFRTSWSYVIRYKTIESEIAVEDCLTIRSDATLAAIDAALEYLSNKE